MFEVYSSIVPTRPPISGAEPSYLFHCCCPSSPRSAGRATMLLVAVCVTAAQWALLGSAAAFFEQRAGINNYFYSVVCASGAFVMFFLGCLCCIVASARKSAGWLLLCGLSVTMIPAIALAMLSSPWAGQDTAPYQWSSFSLLLVVVFCLGIGYGSVTIFLRETIGVSPLNYGLLLFCALVARALYPWTSATANWMVSVACFAAVPMAIALIVLLTNSSVVDLPPPDDRWPVAKAAVVISRIAWRTPSAVLLGLFDERLIHDSQRCLGAVAAHIVPLSLFWAAYFQVFGLWFLQAKEMSLSIGGSDDNALHLQPEHMTALLPFLGIFLHWLWSKFAGDASESALRCASHFGYVLAVAACGCATILQDRIDDAAPATTYSVVWQVPQYVLLSAAEALVYPATVYTVYRSSPVSMRDITQCVLWLNLLLGNVINVLVVLIFTRYDQNSRIFKLIMFGIYLGISALAAYVEALVTCADCSQALDAAPLPEERSPLILSPREPQPANSASSASPQLTLRGPSSPRDVMPPRRPVTPRDTGGQNIVYYSTRRSSHQHALHSTSPQREDTNMQTRIDANTNPRASI